MLALSVVAVLMVAAPDDRLAGAAALALAIPAALLLVVDVIRSERRRHALAEQELAREAASLESLVSSLGALAATPEPREIAELARHEAERLFEARAELVPPGGARDTVDGEVLLPLRLREENVELLRLVTERPLGRAEVARALVLADFVERAHENARLRVEAEVREAERARLSDQLVSAEQDERRRLALHLHDTSVQSLSGIALMLDAVQHAVGEGRLKEGRTILTSALPRLRETIRELRDLSFALEPVVLRDQGFEPAVAALAERLGLDGRTAIELDVAAADELAEMAQTVLYQIIREALDGALRRGPPSHVSVTVREGADGAFEAQIADDAPGERRRAGFEAIAARARTVSGEVSVEHGEPTGTTVHVHLPRHARRNL